MIKLLVFIVSGAIATLKVQRLPRKSIYRPYFTKYAKAFGVTVVADAEVSDAKVLHAISVAAEYLDNNGDGYADSPVACDLEKNKALLHMTGTNAAAEKVTSDDKFMDRI